MPSVIQKIVKSEAVAKKTQAQPIRPTKAVTPKMRTRPLAPRAPRKKKKKGLALPAAAGAVGAVGGAASIRDPRRYMGKHLGEGTKSMENLLSKAQAGDIILSGRKSDFARLGPDDIKHFSSRVFYRSLKTGTQSYTPHGMVVYGPKKKADKIVEWSGKKRGEGIVSVRKSKVMPQQIANQIENLVKSTGGEVVTQNDRIVLLRPKKKMTPNQLKALKTFSMSQIKAERPYAGVQASIQGVLGGIFPKRVRECLIGANRKSSFCTGLPGEAMQRAGAPIVKGKGSAALAKDIISSKKLKAVGWAGAPITKLEKLKAVHAPRAIRSLAYGAGAAAAAYGVAKLVGKMRAGKKAGTK